MIEYNTDTEECISLEMGYGNFPNCIGWQGISEVKGCSVDFKILQ